jgi:hypothetical protein
MSKSSLEYTELAGLQIFLSQYKQRYVTKYGAYEPTYNINIPAGPQAVISELETRIAELQRK